MVSLGLYTSAPGLMVWVAMRVEWTKMKARSERWAEEKDLVVEEMRRVVEYLDWKAQWWRSQGTRRTGLSPMVMRGLGAYTTRQALVYEQMAKSFAGDWYPSLKKFGIHADWCAACL